MLTSGDDTPGVNAAVRQLEKHDYGVLVGFLKSEVLATRLLQVISNRKTIDLQLLE